MSRSSFMRRFSAAKSPRPFLSAAFRHRRCAMEWLEARELLAVVSFHWSADEQAGALDIAADAVSPTAVLNRYASVSERHLSGGKLEAMGRSSIFETSGSAADLRYRVGEVADAFLNACAQELGLSEPTEELVPQSIEIDQIGMTHVAFEQQYDGVPVLGTGLKVHLAADGSVSSASGQLVSGLVLSATPGISAESADTLAIQLLKEQAATGSLPTVDSEFAEPASSTSQTAGETTSDFTVLSTSLCIFNRGILESYDESESTLVWVVQLQGDASSNGQTVYLDAGTGVLVDQEAGISTAIQPKASPAASTSVRAMAASPVASSTGIYREVYDGSTGQYLLDSYDSTYDYTFGRSEGQPARGANPIYQTDQVDLAYDLLGTVHDYYLTEFGRDGADYQGGMGDGVNVPLGVTRVTVFDANMPADACYRSSALWFGDGVVSVEVVGHEYAHAVSWHSITGVPRTQIGGLDESFSDVFGEMLEYYVRGGSDWTMGGGVRWYYYARRYLSDPYVNGWPDRATMERWGTPTSYSLGIIPSHAAYLVAMGGPYNGYNVRALGIEKMQQIWYRAYTEYFNRSETFNAAYHDFIQAARDLYGDADAEEVRKALAAVEMNVQLPPPQPRVAHQSTVGEIAVQGTPVTSASIRFDQDMNLAAMLAAPAGDGSITSAVSIVNLKTGAVALDAAQFAYDSPTCTLTWTADAPLPAGYYELRLRGDLLTDTAGLHLWSGTSGLAFGTSTFAAIENLQVPGSDLTVEGVSSPSLGDWNSDGLTDLLVGENTADGQGRIRVYLNSGTAESPAYTTSFYAPSGSGDLAVPSSGGGVSCRFVDFNSDGRKDLVLGLSDGSVEFAMNVGTTAAPQFAAPVSLTAGPTDSKSPIHVGSEAVVDVADWNNDGRPDLIVGAADGRVRIYLNESDGDQPGSSPYALASPIVARSGAADLIVRSGSAAPAVLDLDGDGRKDLVIGDAEGQLLFYPNRGSDSAPQFDGWQLLQAGGTTIDLPGSLRPGVADFNGDGLADLILGGAGGLVRVALAVSPPAAVEKAQIIGEQGQLYVHTFSSSDTPASGPSVTVSRATDQADPTNADILHFVVTFSQPVSDFDAEDVAFVGSSAAGLLTATVSGSGTSYDVYVTGMAGTGTVVVSVPAGVAHDETGAPNKSSPSGSNTVFYDATQPTAFVGPYWGAVTNGNPIQFTAHFSEPVTGFDASDISFAGSTAPGNLVATVVSFNYRGIYVSQMTYAVTVTGMTGSGTVVVNILPGAAADPAGNSSAASDNQGNSVVYDVTRPTVTINQREDQSDPASTGSIHFTVIFSEPVVGFTAADVWLTDSAAPGNLVATVTGKGTTYDVAVSGMTGSGTVVASIPADVVSDTAGWPYPCDYQAGNSNDASTSTDNVVTYIAGEPTIGSLTSTPEPVTRPGLVTLEALGVSDPDGSVVSVAFYRETNGTAGLQTGTDGDTLVGTDSDGSDGWTASISTASLTVGTYTYYAQATDDAGAASADGTAAVSATSTVQREIVPLGPVDYLRFSAQDPSPGERWYSLETTHAGLLTLEALSAGASLSLYDAAWTPLGDAQRLDREVSSGQTFYFTLTGTVESAQVRLTNLVSQNGSALTVYGTDVADFFVLDLSNGTQIQVNSVAYAWAEGELATISFDGGDGDDRVTVNGRSTDDTILLDHAAITINELSVVGSNVETWRVNGRDGNDTFAFVAGTFTLNGGAGTDTLLGPDAANTWQLATSGTLNETLVFTSLENLTGGAQEDVFQILGRGAVLGTIDGGGGNDRLDYSGSSRAAVVNLATHTATSTRGIRNLESLTGSPLADSLYGPNTANTWDLTGAKAGELAGVLGFTEVESLFGGTDRDRFRFQDAANDFATISGGGGSDMLDYSAVASPVTINLEEKTASKLARISSFESLVGSSATDTLVGPDVDRTWLLTGLDTGTVGSTGFDSFENLTGGTGNDSFRIKSATAGVSGELNGGEGIDTLVGYNKLNTWNLTGLQAGSLNGTTFAGFENLTGGSATDRFVFEEAAVGFGTLNAGTGSDVLDYSPATSPITVNLQQKTVSKLTSFSSIESFFGSGASDTLVGLDADQTWNLTDLDTGTVGSMQFASFENLTGGSGNDRFRLTSATAGVSGQLDGAGGTDTLTGFGIANTWDLTGLRTGTLNGMRFTGIENLTGSSSTDRFVFHDPADGFGTLAGGGGSDTLDYSAVTGPVEIDRQQKTASKLTSFSSIESFIDSGVSLADWTQTGLACLNRLEHVLNSSTLKKHASAVDELFNQDDVDWLLASSEQRHENQDPSETLTLVP